MGASEHIEAYLRAERDDRIEKNILSSEVRVIENLLKNRLNLQGFYAELLKKAPERVLPWRPGRHPWQDVIDATVSTAAFFSPELLFVRREALRRVNELTDDIQAKARELAHLLRARSEHCSAHGIIASYDHHPLDVLAAATEFSESHYLHSQWVAPILTPIREEFDLKYWPRTADYLDALANMQAIGASPSDGLACAAMESRQGKSPRDFVRALDAALKELEDSYGIRTAFSHRAIAEISNCALGLSDGDMLNPASVKSARAYARRMGGAKPPTSI